MSMKRYTEPHPFEAGEQRPDGRGGWYHLCARCKGTEDATFGRYAPGEAPPVHVDHYPGPRPSVLYVTRKQNVELTDTHSPAKCAMHPMSIACVLAAGYR